MKYSFSRRLEKLELSGIREIFKLAKGLTDPIDSESGNHVVNVVKREQPSSSQNVGESHGPRTCIHLHGVGTSAALFAQRMFQNHAMLAMESPQVETHTDIEDTELDHESRTTVSRAEWRDAIKQKADLPTSEQLLADQTRRSAKGTAQGMLICLAVTYGVPCAKVIADLMGYSWPNDKSSQIYETLDGIFTLSLLLGAVFAIIALVKTIRLLSRKYRHRGEIVWTLIALLGAIGFAFTVFVLPYLV